MKTINKKVECRAKLIALMRHFRNNEGESLRDAKEHAERAMEENDYWVYNEEEADMAAREYILDSVWAFNPRFLKYHLRDGIEEDIIKLLQQKSEDANEAIKSMIKDIDHFVDDAILSDGRGHFLSAYDGEEQEQLVDGKYYFMYRQN